ncbi:GNAT family N-acetyltransferase [Pseudoalteromonas sp. SG45-5]|uniref:GNAT family N-acetyltransferase n=1 Tax=unclassified Pseudoalteromonas TaxID=194690 RepID=UPI0015FAE5FE|nr:MULTISPECIES: GNAT family N-acetyltransferase [unclassified Pseudoalteromonas]MBB1387152.1 GNAT family N-acetyltransferase [Pseudoalteromonas sp. SG45-5]MBB1395428.1 GNAT family N-acetyltransferase [Pseudoalteromonas sp. SG44-4]MBB1447511.1 GNAT family N-acetyltransferase [Pseudoalteromonas sp. SG41-6]
MYFSSFSTTLEHTGKVTIRLLQPTDMSIICTWLKQPYAHFWGMNTQTEQQMCNAYQDIISNTHHHAYVIEQNNELLALVELYDPAQDSLMTAAYKAQKHDVGMHILLSPNTSPKRHFSFEMMQCVLQSIFANNAAARVVVEPDIANNKIHTLNKRLGFVHTQHIQLGKKQAYLGFCEKAAFDRHTQLFAQMLIPLNTDYVKHSHWQWANRHLQSKALTELVHERLLIAEQINQTWQVNVEGGYFTFSGRAMALNHIDIDEPSLCFYNSSDEQKPLDVLRFFSMQGPLLGLTGERLATYLEELNATLASACFKRENNTTSAEQLAQQGLQQIESAMSEGHPAFIANNGRIGFSKSDFLRYAPEVGKHFKVIWLAAHKSVCTFAHSKYFADYESHINGELDLTTRDHFSAALKNKNLNLDDYLLMPAHPWQWQNKLSVVFANELASERLVYLGQGDDLYQAQQSIRTLYNSSHPHKPYLKVALSILNMGFMRGLSRAYMAVTPLINDWVFDKVSQDTQLKATNFVALREYATLGYAHHTFEQSALGDTAYRKMFACLWRENPNHNLNSDEQLTTMAALLHLDNNGQSMVGAWLDQSGLSTNNWLQAYFNVYLIPLVHCFYAHKLVFMPHGENLILKLKNSVPVGAYMKDIGEEVALLNSDEQLPESVKRIHITMPKEHELLSIFTDVFDCFFRYLVAILVREKRITEHEFWQCVSQSVKAYQHATPALNERFKEYDFFSDEFAHSCLNRLQLGNNKQMVDLADPAGSLQFAGSLNNPVASSLYG